MDSKRLCQLFTLPGIIVSSDTSPSLPFTRGLLDTGAQGSNFISHHMYQQLPQCITGTTRAMNRVVRLGDARHLSVQSEVYLTVAIQDSTGLIHQHSLWYSVLHDLSHDIIIGLIDLIGPYFNLFADSIHNSRHVMATRFLGDQLLALTTQIQEVSTQRTPDQVAQSIQFLDQQRETYQLSKSQICDSTDTIVNSVALEDGSATDLLSNLTHGTVFADDRVENRYTLLSSLLEAPKSGDLIPPWSQPIDIVAPEETNTPDPTSFPDDILAYLSSTPEEARRLYDTDLETHVTTAMKHACPNIIDILTSPLAYDVFVPRTWKGITMHPYHLKTKPGLPDHLKARARPVREALYKDAKLEFDRMKTYFYEKSTSPIACPLVVAPKATQPFIRLCGDYRPINSYIQVSQEPIPNVQQALAKAAGWKIFIDLDMTNSFHQIPIDDDSSDLLSVSTPWGLFRPKFLPEGVGPASGILQSIVRKIFADFDDWIIVIFDNFLILASDYKDAASKLQQVLQQCHIYRLVLKMKKSWIGIDVVTFFGYEVRPGSWSLSDSRKQSINSMLFPTTQKQMQSFLGAANFFHTHIPHYATWASNLYECTVTSFNWNPTTWTKDYHKLFDNFKSAIQNSVTLHFPDYSLPWIIRSDSSNHAVGAVLFQEYTAPDDSVVHQPISFASHKYSGSAVNWDTYKQEAYALYYAVTQFGYYLRGKEFTVETDHRNLVWIETSLVPIVIRWRVLLQSYNFTVRHIPGLQNTVADWLSRMFPETSSTLSTIQSPLTPSEMFNEVHGKRALHYGAKRTYLALCKRFPGHGISMQHVQDLVAECPMCQKDRLPITIVPHSTTVQTLMHHQRTIGMDHVSVTPADEDGYIGLLLLVELDTKFPQAYPIRDYTAHTVATILFKHYCTFGVFNAVLSDPGSALIADSVQQLNKWLGISQLVSIIGRHESNGTEHVNSLFMGHLRRLVHDERLTHRWASDTVLPLINHALSTSPNDELGGLSPSELKFGTIGSAFFKLPQPLSPGNYYNDFVQQLDATLSTIRSITQKYQRELRHKRQSTNYLQQQNQYQQGDLILWNPREHSHSMRSSKLAPKLLGPYSVTSQEQNKISCVHLQHKTTHEFHSDRVTPFLGSPDHARNIALLDREEFVVQEILAHRGQWRTKTSIEFLVRWAGYDSTSDSWEPWHEMIKVQLVHDYLIKIGMASKIPSKYSSSTSL